ncbi:cullin-4A [Trichonephila clavipes]|nr:cullin-4A [Trichonephila clavipes]
MSLNPKSLKNHRVGERCTLNPSRAQTSSRWCSVVVRRGGGCQVPTQVWSSSLDHVSKGLGSNTREGMNVCKCIVPSQHGGILNSHKSSPVVGGRKSWRPLHPQGILPQNWCGTEQNRTVTCLILKPKANDRCKNLALSHEEFRGP